MTDWLYGQATARMLAQCPAAPQPTTACYAGALLRSLCCSCCALRRICLPGRGRTCLTDMKLSSPKGPSSRPNPLFLTPPQGAWQKQGCEQLTHTMPASSAAATRLQRGRESGWVHGAQRCPPPRRALLLLVIMSAIYPLP